MPKEVYIISPSLTMCYHVSFCTSIAFFDVFCLDLVFNKSDFGYACVLYEIKKLYMQNKPYAFVIMDK